MDSTLTLIDGGTLYYRGVEAAHLARQASVEETAALLWTGRQEEANTLFSAPLPPLPARCRAIWPHLAGLPPIECVEVLLPLLAADDLAAHDLRPEAVVRTGARLLRRMAALVTQDEEALFDGTEPHPSNKNLPSPKVGRGVRGEGLSTLLQRAWMPDKPETERLLSAALILCADHELNVSSFTARCVASAGSTLYAVVTAGIAALRGIKHGGHGERVAALFQEAGTPEQARPALAARLRRGENLSGFGHQLYPEGDIRARVLLDLLQSVCPDSPEIELAEAIAASAREAFSVHPNIDFALVALARALRLPPGGAFALFALGRTIGWIGHALEEYPQNRLIRPRARYTGPPPR